MIRIIFIVNKCILNNILIRFIADVKKNNVGIAQHRNNQTIKYYLLLKVTNSLISQNLILQLNGSAKPVPPPRDHLRIEKDGRLVSRAPAPPQVPDRKTSVLQTNTTGTVATQNHQIAQIVEPTADQLGNIKKYQVRFFSYLSIYLIIITTRIKYQSQ